MHHLPQHRWSTVVLLFALLASFKPPALAQPSSTVSAQLKLVDTPAPPDQESASALTVTGPGFQPSPEQIGDAMMLHQRYQAAIQAYKDAPASSPAKWNKMGIAYQLMFNLQDAARCYQVALKLDPKNIHAINNLGTVYDSLKQFGQAERMYQKALKLAPQSALIHKNLGTALLAEHKYDQGWEEYKAASALDPGIFQNQSGPRVDNPASAQDRGAMNYYMAKGCAHVGKTDSAIDYLRLSLNEGFASPKKIIADAEFSALRGNPAFDQLLADQSPR
jgi:tetratricopeptide (TPR) repeat protein